MKHKKTKIRYDRVAIFILGVLVVSFFLFLIIAKIINGTKNVISNIVSENMYLSSIDSIVELYSDDFTVVENIARGTLVNTYNEVEHDETTYKKIKYNKHDYYVKKESLTKSIDDVVKEEKVYVRTPVTIYENSDDIKIIGFASKNSALEIIGYNKLLTDGTVDMYRVKYNNIEGYVYSKYVQTSDIIDDALSLKYHKDRKFNYELYGGEAVNLDYYPHEKANFKDNVMPDVVNAFYLTSTSISNIDEYINIAKSSNINAFVVDIKDGSMAYESEVAKKYSISNYNSAANSYEKYKNVIDKLKKEGFYVIGRIVAFNDYNFAKDNKSETIANTTWVSAYSRLAWEFNVSLAIEAVENFGFNEIQFDYVRFPESSYTYSKEGYDFRNKYNEEKGQAIQNFLIYATDEIHKKNAYVSADVFGECVGTYVTAYGQYFPNISNIVDVISAMPYPDHFAKGTYGIETPWLHPYEILNSWAKRAFERQKEIETPAKVRTWIQAYDAIKSPHNTYGEYEIKEQIKGLNDAGLTDGVITWNGSSSLTKYDSIKGAF